MVYGAVESVENFGSFLGQLALRIAKEATENTARRSASELRRRCRTCPGALPVAWPWLGPLVEAAAKVVGNRPAW